MIQKIIGVKRVENQKTISTGKKQLKTVKLAFRSNQWIISSSPTKETNKQEEKMNGII